MISEKWNIQFDIEKLQDHLKNVVLPNKITRQSGAFGGWSVLSSDGTITDGWQMGHVLFDPTVEQSRKEAIKSQIKKRFSEYTVETDICSGYLVEVIEAIRKQGLSPFRARIICLSAESASSWHFDAAVNEYAVRLHIPIVTNDGCFFETRSESEHLKADGSAYFIYVNREHRVYNKGPADRFHIVMDVVDKNQATIHHRYEDFYSKPSLQE